MKQSFELVSGDSTDTYEVERKADGVFRLKLRMNYHGDPHNAIAYMTAVGNAESLLKIVPLQTEIDARKEGDDESEEERRPRRQHVPNVLPAPKDEVRQSLISHQRKAAAKKASNVQ